MRTRMLPILVALSVPALAAAQSPARPQRTRSETQSNAGSSADRHQLACAPEAELIAPAMAMRVIGGYEHGKLMFAPNDPLIIGAGTKQGLRAGQEYFVRRVVKDQFSPMAAASVLESIHTAGWVRIVDANENVSVATVTEACDGVLLGDYLDPYVDAVMPADTAIAGTPDFTRPARLVLADERRQSGSPGMLMLMDRGSEDGVRAGQRVTIFRYPTTDPHARSGAYGTTPAYSTDTSGPILAVGEATVLSVRPKTSLVRIDTASGAVYIGDLVAIHRVP
jgi:hypothetical protein